MKPAPAKIAKLTLLFSNLKKYTPHSGDIDEIDARWIKREKEKWGNDYFPETHPDSYFRQVIMALLQRYTEQYRPEKVADFVLSVD